MQGSGTETAMLKKQKSNLAIKMFIGVLEFKDKIFTERGKQSIFQKFKCNHIISEKKSFSNLDGYS